MKRLIGLLTFKGAVAAAATTIAFASDAHKPAPYAGQQTREIKSLSAQDIADIEAGRGWGLAKSAELGGYPGPAHVLELAEKLKLTSAQRDQVQAVFDKMDDAARVAGRAFLNAERALDEAFASGSATPKVISDLTAAAGQLRGKLRAVHLNAHLETTPLLTQHQRHLYVRLRGYGGGHAGKAKGSHSGDAKGSHSGQAKGSHSGH